MFKILGVIAKYIFLFIGGVFLFTTSSVAEASSTYTVIKIPAILPSSDSNTPVSVNSKIKVDLRYLSDYNNASNIMEISLPTGVIASLDQITIEVPEYNSSGELQTLTQEMISLSQITSNRFLLTLSGVNLSGSGQFYINFGQMIITESCGDLCVHFNSLDSSFTSGSFVIAKIVSPGSISVYISSVKKFATTISSIDTIMFREASPSTFTPGTIINFTLSAGFEWDESNSDQTVSVEGSMGLAGSGNNAALLNLGSTSITDIWYEISRLSPTTLRVLFLPSFGLSNTNGIIRIGNDSHNTLPIIKVTSAQLNSNVCLLASSPNNQFLNQQELTIAKYVDEESINANLAYLNIDGISVNGFNPDTTNYNVTLPYGTTLVPVISANTPQNNGTSPNIYQAINLTGTEQERTATVIVTSPDGSVTKTYKVVFSVLSNNPDDLNCFIATAAFGSYLDPHVWVLRQFRDNTLLRSSAGIWFVEEYYQYSPPIAAVISKHPPLKFITRTLLTPLIFGIQYPETLCFLGILLLVGLLVKRGDIYIIRRM